MAWTTREYIIGLILFSAVIALFYIAVGDMATTYDRSDLVDPSFSENYDKLTENQGMAADMLNSSSSSSGLSILGTADIILSSTFSIISLTFGSLTTFSSQISHIGTDIGMPTEVQKILLGVLITIITIGLVLIIINAVNKTEKL